jgi:hypothetical protein
VKNKTVEALQYGVPIVATSEAAAGIPPSHLDALWTTDDPTHFANAVIELLSNRRTWERFRAAQLDHLAGRAAERPDVDRWIDVIEEELGHEVKEIPA